MRQTYLTSDNPTVVNRLRKDCREYARQRELEEWFENIHHVRLAWKEDADGKRTVEGVEAVMSKETLTVQGKGDLKGYWLMPLTSSPRMNAGDSRILRFGFLFATTKQERRGR